MTNLYNIIEFTTHQQRPLMFHNFKDIIYTNKLIFFNGTLGEIMKQSSRYLYYKPFKIINATKIDVSTIFLSIGDKKTYYSFNINEATQQTKVLISEIMYDAFIFENDVNDFKDKTLITINEDRGERLIEIIDIKNEKEHIFKTRINQALKNIQHLKNRTTDRDGNANQYYLNIIDEHTLNFKINYGRRTLEDLLKFTNNEYKDLLEDLIHVSKCFNIHDEIRKAIIKDTNEKNREINREFSKRLNLQAAQESVKNKIMNAAKELNENEELILRL